MTPAQIVSIIIATIVSAIAVVFTIKENTPKIVVNTENDSEKRETAIVENENQLFSFQDILKEVVTQN